MSGNPGYWQCRCGHWNADCWTACGVCLEPQSVRERQNGQQQPTQLDLEREVQRLEALREQQRSES